MAPFATVITGCLVILEATNRFSPKGGVNIPMAQFTTITIPRCIGSMPACVAIGKNSGPKIVTMEAPSRNMPAISIIMFISARMTHVSLLSESTASDILTVTFSEVRIHANIEAPPMRIIICTVETADF